MSDQVVYQVTNFKFNYPFSQRKIKLDGSFTIFAGECVLLQGASGSGKSTLLAALKGLIPHLIGGKLSGKIEFMGQDLHGLDELALLKIGYLLQNPDSQLVCQTVFSELAFGLENQGLPAEEIRQKIMAISRQFNITNLLAREVVDLSGGEKQKINLLAILLMEPEVLLLDEPTAFLDPPAAAEIMAIIAEYVKNKTVIIVEHNLHYLKALIKRNIYIDEKGNIFERDLSQIIWQQPLSSCCTEKPAKPATAILEVKNLSYSYPQTNQQQLKNINLTLYPGEIVALRGANGAGKSTLLKLISKVIPSQQAIYWQASDIYSLKPVQLWKSLSLLWQNPEAHFLATTVAEELNHDLHAIKQVNLSEQSQQSPFNLSEGQKRRLSLAIVLQRKPQLLLLDEPTFGQDYQNKQKLADILCELATKHQVAMLMVSHDQAFTQALAQREYLLHNGELLLQDREPRKC